MSDTEEETPSIRQRHIDEAYEPSEKDELLQPESESESQREADSEVEEIEEEQEEEVKPEILLPRVYRGFQPPPPPSFLSQQFRNFTNFFIELFEFIMLFITTLVHSLADVDTQVSAHNQRRDARRQAGFRPPQQASFPFPSNH